MTDDKALATIKKLLRLAENAGTQEEAEAAAAKAQALMTQHAISAAMIGDKYSDEQPITMSKDEEDGAIDLMGRLPEWRTSIVRGLTRMNGCWFYTGYRRGGRTYEVVGQKADRDNVKYLYQWIAREVDHAAKREALGRGKVWANNFRIGMVERILERMREAKQNTIREWKAEQTEAATTPEEKETALVLISTAMTRMQNQPKAAREHAYARMRFVSTRSTGGMYSGSGRDAGRAAGNGVSLGGSKGRIGGGVRRLTGSC